MNRVLARRVRRGFGTLGVLLAMVLGSAGENRVAGQSAGSPAGNVPAEGKAQAESEAEKKMMIATFGGGCFWCVEAAMERLKGVSKVVSGYEGGTVPNPTYEQVCTKTTGHIEVCQVHFDPEIITFGDLMDVFFKIHDPTTRDKQGADEGPQYRSVIFFHSPEQRDQAMAKIQQLDESKTFRGRKIVTEVLPTKTFYLAEDYHQDYFAKNPTAAYCRAVVLPKVRKVNIEFKDKVKDRER